MVNFLFGKVGTALLNMLAFFMLAHLLNIADYGAYMTFIALIEMVSLLTVGSFDQVAVQLIPDYRLHAGDLRTSRMIQRLFVIRTVVSVLGMMPLILLGDWVLSFFNQSHNHGAYPLFLLSMSIEFASRFLRDGVLGSLLMQGRSQMALLLRNLTIVTGLFIMSATQGSLSLTQAAWIELIGSSIGLLIVLPITFRAASVGAGYCKDWVAPDWKRTFWMVWHNYVCLVLSFIFSAQTVTVLASKFYGVEAAALFGFARGLVDQIRRYLPAELFLGVVRPVMVAGFAREKDFSKLNWQANLVYKIGMFSLFPIIAVFFSHGDMILNLLHGGKYPDSQYYVLLLLITLIPISYKRAIEMVVNIVRETDLWLSAAVSSILVLPFLVCIYVFDLRLTGLVLTVMAVEWLTNLVLALGLRRRGYPYQIDWLGFAKLLLLTVLTVAIVSNISFGNTLFDLALMVAITVVVYLVIGRLLRPFSDHERNRVNALLKRNLFVW
ncbi:O-antigen/teichoic acid export membrane protein [Chitinivorax tropicus]|uniref:O-antigen/teichoic acid export membrane protein n=1 Tax=Chitinivorax tropicus TaxID=714531 RepID=A0A840MLR3_9PROT|nr:oligosaccharide flippase family protein [Chitinivorax tropicus]MBB5019578.1 O-antigen/teichoic acid export membrane protein [Chitinivorax tropicus]